jgi:hypothetical protein
MLDGLKISEGAIADCWRAAKAFAECADCYRPPRRPQPSLVIRAALTTAAKGQRHAAFREESQSGIFREPWNDGKSFRGLEQRAFAPGRT